MIAIISSSIMTDHCLETNPKNTPTGLLVDRCLETSPKP